MESYLVIYGEASSKIVTTNLTESSLRLLIPGDTISVNTGVEKGIKYTVSK